MILVPHSIRSCSHYRYFTKIIVIASLGSFLSYHIITNRRCAGVGREAGGFSGVRLSWARNGIVTGRDGARCGVRSLGKSLCETEFLFDGD